LTSELERIKILEEKISQVVDYINKLINENTKLKQQLKELKSTKKDFEDEAKRAEKLHEDLERYERERGVIKEKIDSVISLIDQLEI
jgi:chromosome segregation ATPase